MFSSSNSFFTAVERGEVDRVRSILQEGQDVNATRTRRGFLEIPIFLALRVREDAMLELLLEHGANMNQVSTSFGVAPLHKVALYPHGFRSASKAQLLLSHGAEVDPRDVGGSTPLHNAARVGNEAVVEILLQNGADLDAVDKLGRTPLHDACIGKRGNENVLRMLIERGANLNASDNSGLIPINEAIREAHDHLTLLLMEAHAKHLMAVDNSHPGLWAQAFATVGSKKTPGRLSLLFSLLQQKPDLLDYSQCKQNARKRKRSD